MKRTPAFWTDERFARAKEVLGTSPTLAEAAEKLSAEWGRDVTVPALQTLFRDREDNAGVYLAAGPAQKSAATKVAARTEMHRSASPSANVGSPVHQSAPAVADRAPAGVDDLVALARKFAKRGGLTVQVAADELDLSPRRTVELFQRAQRDGYRLDFVHNEITFAAANAPPKLVSIPTPPPELGREIVVGVASDIHFASKHHEAEALRTHIHRCYDAGARHIFVPGDLVAGGGRYLNFLKYEVTCIGIEAQCAVALEGLPQLPGLRYELCGGNHDESFDVGISAARMLVTLGQQRGRNDLYFHGDRGARVHLLGLRWEMYHPCSGGSAYALSYRAQKHIDGTAPIDRPDVLMIGHWHKTASFLWGGVQCLLAGTFESGDSSFGRSIGGDVALGGWLIRYTLGSDGKLARYAPEWCSYPQTKMQYVDVA